MNVGYSEVEVGSGRLKGKVTRSWRRHEPRQGLVGAKLDAWVDRMAKRYPANVRPH